MKITNFKYFKPLEITVEQPKTLIIEDPVYYRKIISELIYQSESNIGEFVLFDEKDKNYDISKNCLIITDMFDYVSLEKQIKTKLNNMIVNEYQIKEEATALITQINTIGVEIMNSYMYPVKFKDNLTFQDVIKMMDFTIDYSELNFLERFIEYTKMCFELLGYKLLITINFKEVISKEEYYTFKQDMMNRGILLLMIERHSNSELDFDEDVTIIDKDLCML